MKIAWITHAIPGSGVSAVCHDAASALACDPEFQVSLVATHECSETATAPADTRLVSLGLPHDTDASVHQFHDWLLRNPQDLILLNDDRFLEPYLPHVAPATRSVVVIHDDGLRYVEGVLRYREHLDAVVAVSAHIKRLVRRKFPDYRGMLRTVHNGGSFPEAIPRSEAGSQLRLLFMGRLDYLSKGVGDIPRILRSLSTLGFRGSLTVLGGVDGGLQRRCSKAAPHISVSWPGRVPRAECFRAAACHDVLLLPSRKEPFGMVTIEAMAMGCVPIAYDVESGSREIIQNGTSGFLVPFADYREFALRIMELHHDRQLLRSMSDHATRRARARFSSERMGMDYAALIHTLMSQEGRTVVRLPIGCYRPAASRAALYHRLPLSWRVWLRRAVGRSTRLARLVRRWQW